MKKISMMFLLATVIVSCSPDSGDLTNTEKKELFTKVRSDSSFIELTELKKSHLIALAKNHYGHSSTNGEVIKSGLAKCKNEQEVIELYKKAGFKNAEKYLTTTNRIIYLTAKLKDRYPELNSLSKQDRKELFKAPTTGVADLQSIAESRK